MAKHAGDFKNLYADSAVRFGAFALPNGSPDAALMLALSGCLHLPGCAHEMVFFIFLLQCRRFIISDRQRSAISSAWSG
jgi:hypothetical protein